LSVACTPSGTFRIWIILLMLEAQLHVHYMKSRSLSCAAKHGTTARAARPDTPTTGATRLTGSRRLPARPPDAT
jgi:hypothetical protein